MNFQLLMSSVDWDTYFVLILRIQRLKIYVESLWSSHVSGIQLLNWFNNGFRHSAFLLQFILKIRSVGILDTIVCWGTLLWLFSQACDAIKLTMKVGFICPFVVIDPTDFGSTTELLFQASCLFIFNLSLKQNTCPFAHGNEANLFAKF